MVQLHRSSDQTYPFGADINCHHNCICYLGISSKKQTRESRKNWISSTIETNKDTASNLSEENAVLSKELKASKDLINKLEEKTSPRELSEQQRTTLASLLSFESPYLPLPLPYLTK